MNEYKLTGFNDTKHAVVVIDIKSVIFINTCECVCGFSLIRFTITQPTLCGCVEILINSSVMCINAHVNLMNNKTVMMEIYNLLHKAK